MGSNSDDMFEINWKDKVILIVDDDEVSYILLKEFLSITNANILHAITGQSAFEIIELIPKIDIILMDIQIPILNGYEIVKIMQKSHPEIPIIANTAYRDIQDEADNRNVKFDGYISKPIRVDELFNTLGK